MPKEIPERGSPVDEREDLRRALHNVELDDEGKPPSSVFRTKDMSVDVAGLCTLAETQARHPGEIIAIVACIEFRRLGEDYYPVHWPEDADAEKGVPANPAHALVRKKLGDGKARQIARIAAQRLVFPGAPAN